MLFSQMEPPAHLESAFHEWYETEHIPVRLALGGFESAARYAAVTSAPKYLAVYELSDMKVLDTDDYKALKLLPTARTATMLSSVGRFTRFTCEKFFDAGRAIRGNLLWAGAFVVPRSNFRIFEQWWAREEERFLAANVHAVRARTYRVISGEGGAWTHLALRDFNNAQIPEANDGAIGSSGHFDVGEAAEWTYRLLSEHQRRLI